MRTLLLALAFMASVAAGAVLVRSPWPWVPPGLAILIAGSLGLALLGPLREHDWTPALAGLLVCAGLLRGASLGPPEPPRVPERGPGERNTLRDFVVEGASTPGPRCLVTLRSDPRSRPISVEAPAEACPLAHGDHVAVLASTLAPSWQAELLERETRVLGRGPAIWRRPALSPPTDQHAARTSWRRRYWSAVASLRQRAWLRTRGDEQASLVVAVGLGQRRALSPSLRARLRAAGLGHLIAVSGLHVAVAALWFMASARRVTAAFALSPSLASVCTWLPLWAYVGLTGAAPSAVRAAAMLTALELGVLVGRPTHGPTTLALVAALMLAWQPLWLFDPGFALSLAAMTAIVTAPRALGIVALSWRISWATAPVALFYFRVAAMHGLIVNALALPLFAWFMPLALAASVLPGSLGLATMSAAKLLAAPLLDLAALFAEIPGAKASTLVLLSLAGLLLHRLAPAPTQHPQDPTQEPPRWRSWLPPRLACRATLLVAAKLSLAPLLIHPLRPPTFDWLAMGTPQRPALLVRDTTRAHAACLYAPGESAGTWLALLEHAQLTQLSALDSRIPFPNAKASPKERPPHLEALAAALTRGGIALPEPSEFTPSSCLLPPRERLRRHLADCQYLQGGSGRVLVRVRRGRGECRIAARWVDVF